MFQEEISAAFNDHDSWLHQLRFESPKTNVVSSPPKVRKILEQPEQKSPHHVHRPSVTSEKWFTRKYPNAPNINRRNSEIPVKSRRTIIGGDFHRRISCDTRKEQLHSWSREFLKDFDAIVQQEISYLSRCNSVAAVSTEEYKRIGQTRRKYNIDVWEKSSESYRRSLDLSTRPPKPPPRRCKSKLLFDGQIQDTNFTLQRSFSSPEKSLYNYGVSETCVTPVIKSLSVNIMGANSSGMGNRDDPRGPFTTYTLPRGKRRTSLILGPVKSTVSPEHPDASASPCTLLRVGPRLSRSHSLDEAFVPLSQRTYFVPTPLTPAPTPLLKSANDKTRRIGVTDVPFLNTLFPDHRFSSRESNAARKGSLGSDSSCGPTDIPDFQTLLAADQRRVRSLNSYEDQTDSTYKRFEDPLTRTTSDNFQNQDIKIIVDYESISSKESSSIPDATLLKADRPTFGRKSEPSLPATFNLTHPLAEGRRHTLPNKPGGIYSLLCPPTFNASSWDALPPAEEVEVMEDKPIQAFHNIHAHKSWDSTAAHTLPNYKFDGLKPAAKYSINQNYSPSLNSSLSSLSGISGQNCGSDFESLLNVPFDKENVLITNSNNNFNMEIPEPSKDLITSRVITNGTSISDTTTINSVIEPDPEYSSSPASSPASSPEPITATLQLLPLNNAANERSEILFSVVIPDNYKRKKRKVKPKRYSDTVLSQSSAATDCCRSVQRNSTNWSFSPRTTDSSHSDASAAESEANEDFLHYCISNLKLNENDIRKKALLPNCDVTDLKVTDATLRDVKNNEKNDLLNREIRRRSWCQEKAKDHFTLRSSASAMEISSNSVVVRAILMREFNEAFEKKNIHYEE